jgi:hypothetical protein
MSSFCCPHFDGAEDHCLRLQTDCVPGRKGCVLPADTDFLIPAEERVRLLEEAKRRPHPTGNRGLSDAKRN